MKNIGFKISSKIKEIKDSNVPSEKVNIIIPLREEIKRIKNERKVEIELMTE